jgi:uncharacterized protein YegL
MSILEPDEGITRRQMVLFFMVDTSGSMSGTKIGAVNTAIREVIPELSTIGGSDVALKIACLRFSSGYEWMHPAPVPVENFQWNNLAAEGVTDLGAACEELARQMSRKRFLEAPSGSVAPAIFLMSDGQPTDDYQRGIAALQQNNWFKYAIKVAVAIGDDADRRVLGEFTGTAEAVITVHTPEALRKMIRFVSVTSVMVSSTSRSAGAGNRQDDMNEKLADITRSDPDFNKTSTDADAWS